MGRKRTSAEGANNEVDVFKKPRRQMENLLVGVPFLNFKSIIEKILWKKFSKKKLIWKNKNPRKVILKEKKIVLKTKNKNNSDSTLQLHVSQ